MLLAVELLAAGIAFVLGASLGGILGSGGLVVALTLALLNPTFQELGRRQAKLFVVADEANRDALITASALVPWPIDVDRVVANELAAAREPLSWPRGAMNVLQFVGDPFAVKPTDADYARAHDAFEQRLPDFETSLRKWLTDYSTATKECSHAFELTLRVTNARNGAHAEAVTVVLDLPATITVIEGRPDVLLPPERPRFEPPRSRSRQTNWLHEPLLREHVVPLAMPALPSLAPSSPRTKGVWRITDGGRRLEAQVGGVHCGRSVDVGESLPLLADRAGQHEIHWTAYTKSARRSAEGVITLVVPSNQADRPAFGRLHGVVSYPDVPIVDDDGEVVHPVRVVDPPLQPPVVEDGADVLRYLQDAVASRAWNELGLDPATDGPDRSVVVRAGRPVAHRADD